MANKYAAQVLAASTAQIGFDGAKISKVFGKAKQSEVNLRKLCGSCGNSCSNRKPFRGFRGFCVRFPALAPRRPAHYLADMRLTDAIKNIFRRRRADETAEQPATTPQPLRIEGVKPAPLTPEPDDAELAAQALLESMVSSDKFQDSSSSTSEAAKSSAKNQDSKPETRDAAYYRRLAERIRLARDQATLRTMRFVTWCEHELEKRDLPIEGKGSLGQMEAELYKRIDTIERVGGELKHRWQHCLANVIVRRMKEERENTEAAAALIRQPDISSASQSEETTIV